MLMNINNNYVIVDYSYVINLLANRTLNSYEYHFGNIPKDKKELYNINFTEDTNYMNMLQNNIESTIKNIEINFMTYPQHIFFAMDCRKTDIWRRSFFAEYKQDRIIKTRKEEGLNLRPIFNWVNNYFPTYCKSYGYHSISHPVCEADDIIYSLVTKIKEKKSKSVIRIITRDSDFLQLEQPDIILLDIQFNTLKRKYTESKQNLLYKILVGDKSDGIPSCFKQVEGHKILCRGFGEKTAEKVMNDIQLLKELFNEFPESRKQFDLNKKIIQLSNIPQDLLIDLYSLIDDKI